VSEETIEEMADGLLQRIADWEDERTAVMDFLARAARAGFVRGWLAHAPGQRDVAEHGAALAYPLEADRAGAS
jgi:hypothetical protein